MHLVSRFSEIPKPCFAWRAPRSAAPCLYVLLWLVSFVIASHGITAEEQQSGSDQWQLFAGTESPDGRYAVAWGLPKHPGIWAEICRSFRDQAQRKFEDDEKIEVPKDDVENYIVDLREKKVVERLHSHHELVGNYWHLPHLRPNRHDLEVVWSRAGDIVIVNHTFRWDCVTFCAVRISNGRAVGRQDLFQVFDRLLDDRFAKSLRKSGFSKEVVFYVFSDIEQLQGMKYSTYVDAVVPSKDDDGWGEDVVIHFTLNPSGKSGLAVKVLNVHAPKAGENPGTAEHALAKADRQLNAAYSALHAKLDTAAKAALKLEQREWRVRRDRIEDPFERAKFVEARAKELEVR